MRIAPFFAIFLLFVGVAGPAAAQSDYCAPLRAELAALDRGRGGGGSDRQIRSELSRARDEARRNNCGGGGGGGFFRKKETRACGQITSRINRLQRQLSSNRPRGGLFRRSSDERDRQRVLRALSRAGCGSDRNFGTYRTVCVRICDGYYFPISFAAGRQRFNEDAERCMAQYGPGEAVLFYHPNPGGDASQAVSLANDRYADQPYAFAYRQAFHPQCAARLHQGLAVLGERVLASLPPAPPPLSAFEQAIAGRAPTANIPIPIPRTDRASDPETVANRAGGFTPRVLSGRPVIAGVDPSVRPIGDPYLFAEANPGPPPTIAGFKPPELKDFRPALHASMLPSLR